MHCAGAEDGKQDAQLQRRLPMHRTNDRFLGQLLDREIANLHEKSGGDCLADVVVVHLIPELRAVLL
jgi:hypothetical protein